MGKLISDNIFTLYFLYGTVTGQNIPKESIMDTIFFSNISQAIEETSTLIKKTLKNVPTPLKPLTEHLLTAKGKGIRTRLLLNCALNKKGIPKSAINASAAIEIFHLATLVHDDIIDDSHTRRGVASIQTKFGKKQAVICGDYLFCAAILLLSDMPQTHVKFAKKMTNSIQKICVGELRQYANSHNLDINFYEYLKIIQGKTAALFHVAAYGGAILSQGQTLNEKEVKALGKFGTYFGTIFQILDDCKDYILDETMAKKPTNIDIANGVINLPLLMSMLNRADIKERAGLAISSGMYETLIQEVKVTGVTASLEIAHKFSSKADKVLRHIEPTKAAGLKALMAKELNQFPIKL